jgi:glycosyltransferase involved in cell wall biosynthesis
MACGTPVVALQADRGGPSEIIANGVDGLLVTPEQAGLDIVRLLDDPVRMRVMRDKARFKAVTQYSQAVTTNTFRDIVTGALGDKPKKHD